MLQGFNVGGKASHLKTYLPQKLPKFGCPFASMTVNLLDANRTFLGMRGGVFEIVQAAPEAVLRRLVRVRGVDFDEAFVAELIGNHFIRKEMHAEPEISDAVAIYLHESDADDGRKFKGDVLHVFRRFSYLVGDLYLCDLSYAHTCIFRDHLLSLGLRQHTTEPAPV